jgi:L-alanine-DL-glutamate epimerase-like enolase superfamily enzyme
MSKIRRADAYLCDIEVERQRTDAIQAFLKQETIFVEIETDDGISGTGYSYTIGTGGRAVLSLLRHDLLDLLLGEDARQVEGLWQRLWRLLIRLSGIFAARLRDSRCGYWPAEREAGYRSTIPREAGCTSRPRN